MQDNSCAEAWPSALPEQRRGGAQGCRPAAHSWARMLFPILWLQYTQARVGCSVFQRLRLELGCAPGILRVWETSAPAASEGKHGGRRSLRTAPAQRKEGLGEKRLEPRARPARRGRALSVHRGPASRLPLMPWTPRSPALTRPAPCPLSSLRSYLCTPARAFPVSFASLGPRALLSTFLSPRLPSVRCPPRSVCGPGLCSLPRFQ